MKKKIFLGGTCATTTWRKKVIELLDTNKYEYFNPQLEPNVEWTKEHYNKEIEVAENSDILIFVLTSEMVGFFSWIEVLKYLHKGKEIYFYVDLNGFDGFILKSISSTRLTYQEHNNFHDFNSLEEMVSAINNL